MRNVENWPKHTLKILRCLHRKIFKIWLAIFSIMHERIDWVFDPFLANPLFISQLNIKENKRFSDVFRTGVKKGTFVRNGLMNHFFK